jgi:hypothetical protein
MFIDVCDIVRRCGFCSRVKSHVLIARSAMFEMTKQNERVTHSNRNDLNEIELMCRVLMDDSEWLDSYQNTVLENHTGKTDRITILNDMNETNETVTLTSDQQQLEVHRQDMPDLNRLSAEEMCCESKRKQCPNPQLLSFSEFKDLPAREFVFGSKSFVASESVRLMKKAANECVSRTNPVNHTILFKKSSARDES